MFNRSYNKLFLNQIRQAIDDYRMVNKGETIAVGVSGGKDSTLLLYSLDILRRYSNYQFNILALHIDYGWEGDIQPLIEFCKSKEIPLHVEFSQIAKELDFSTNKNPCSLCARLRKGAVSRVCKDKGIKKFAFAHHLDDAVETLLMNMLYTGKFCSFSPRVYDENKDMTMIRPLVYVEESIIKDIVNREGLPVIPASCPRDKCTTRQEMKDLVESLQKSYPDIRHKLLSSLRNVDVENLWIDRQRRE